MSATLEIHGWHSQCGECGYGRGGWAASPALEGKPILDTDSESCHGCGVSFTHRMVMHTGEITVVGREQAA